MGDGAAPRRTAIGQPSPSVPKSPPPPPPPNSPFSSQDYKKTDRKPSATQRHQQIAKLAAEKKEENGSSPPTEEQQQQHVQLPSPRTLPRIPTPSASTLILANSIAQLEPSMWILACFIVTVAVQSTLEPTPARATQPVWMRTLVAALAVFCQAYFTLVMIVWKNWVSVSAPLGSRRWLTVMFAAILTLVTNVLLLYPAIFQEQ